MDGARAALIGGCEGNWIAFNPAHDLTLPRLCRRASRLLMYPEGEVAGVRLDCFEPAAFRYQILAREISI